MPDRPYLSDCTPRLIEFAQIASSINITIHRYPPDAGDWQRRQALPRD
jgi:hypothetical protein